MKADQFLQRARWGFGIAAGLGLLLLVIGVPVMDADERNRSNYYAMIQSTDPAVQELRRKLDAIAGPRAPSRPPEPVAPAVFRTGWHLLLLGLAGSGLVDCAAAIVLAHRQGPADPPEPDPTPDPPQYTTLNPPPTTAHPDPRKPPVLR